MGKVAFPSSIISKYQILGSKFWTSPSLSPIKGEGILNCHFMLQNYLRFYLYEKITI